MRAFVRALSLAATVSAGTSAAAAPSLWDGGLLPEGPFGTTLTRTTIDAIPSTDGAGISESNTALSTAFLWDGGQLPVMAGDATFTTGAIGTTPEGPSAADLEEMISYASPSDEALETIVAAIEQELRARFYVLFDHEGEDSVPSVVDILSAAAPLYSEHGWSVIDALPSPINLARLVPVRKFLVEDEDHLPDVDFINKHREVAGAADTTGLEVAPAGYEDR